MQIKRQQPEYKMTGSFHYLNHKRQ